MAPTKINVRLLENGHARRMLCQVHVQTLWVPELTSTHLARAHVPQLVQQGVFAMLATMRAQSSMPFTFEAAFWA